jgi:hypothetical protein
VLTLTENATLVIKSITGVEGAPDGAGVRISQENPADPSLAVTTTEAPLPGDQVVDDKGWVEFLLVPQPGANGNVPAT